MGPDDLATNGCHLRVVSAHLPDTFNAVAWSPDGASIASASADNTVRIWDAGSGKLLRTLESHFASVQSVSWSPDGETLASGSRDNTVRIWDAGCGKLLRTLDGHFAPVQSASWSADGATLASGSRDNTVRIWDAGSGKLLRTLESHSDFVQSVSWSPDGKTLASGSADKTVRIWDTGSGKLLRTLEGHSASVLSVSWSPDRETLASGSDDKTVRIWNGGSGKLLRTLEGYSDSVRGVSWSEDGKNLASGSWDKTVCIWNAGSGKLLHTLEGHSKSVQSVSWSPDGKTLASGSDDKTVRIWDAGSGKLLRTLEGHLAFVLIVSWSGDGKTLASGSWDKTVRIWDAGSGKLLRTLEGHSNSIWSLSWSGDGKTLASGSNDKTVRIWDAGSGKLLRTLEGHSNFVWSVSWSPDGKTLASGSADKTVRIWDAGSGKLLRTLEGHSDSVRSVIWSADGETLASGSIDKTVRIWDAESGNLVTEYESVAPLSYSLLFVAFEPRGPVTRSCGGTPLGDANILVSIVEPIAQEHPAEMITQVISAKVVLVGESKAGKSYLAHRIATGKQPAQGVIKSTHGMRFWPLAPEQFCAGAEAPAGQRRDVVLWDMGGQEEYRLVHQLFLHDTTVALILFDPTRGATEFKEVATWNKYLVKQLHEQKAVKVLVGAKLDHPSDTLDRKGIERTRIDNGCASFHETSAVTGRGVPELCEAVAKAIDWEGLGTTSRPALFQRIRDEIEDRRKRGEVVLHLSDLYRALDEAARTGEGKEALRTMAGRQAIRTVADQLASQGVIARSRMSTGEEVLVLQVQEIERYAGSLILAARNNPRGVPALEARDISKPDFALPGISVPERIQSRTQEKAVLECTVELLLEHGICFAHEGLLVFPSLLSATAADESEKLPYTASLYYDISGAIDNIYASLVAWLVLAKDFGRLRLAPGRAEFEVQDKGLCGLRKVARPGGFAHVDVYFEDKTPVDLRDAFITFVEDHLSKQGVDLCEHLMVDCPKGFKFDDETLRMAIADGDRQVICPRCKSEHPLHEGAKEVRQRDPMSLENLWGIRTRMEESRKEATREVVRLVGQASSIEPAQRPIRLLHLSDLHFTADTPVSARLQWLLDDLKRDEQDGGLGFKDLDYLVVSGDFTDKACAEGFEKAYEFLSDLSNAFALSSGRCILVPGNHDVLEPIDAYTRRKDSTGLRPSEWVKQGDIIMARDPDKYPLRFKPFSDSLFHKFVQRPYPMPAAEQGIAIPFWETGIQFLTFNSCWEIDEFDRKRAGIHPEAVANAIKQANQQVEDARKGGQLAPDKRPLRIAVWHHAVTAPDFKMKDVQFLGNLQKNGVKLALHGDVHEMRREAIGYWHDRAIHIAGAGSFGARAADKGESVPRLYNVLEIKRDFSAIKVHTRRQLTPDGDWDGYAEWPNPDGSNSRVAHYTIDLASSQSPGKAERRS